MLSLSLSFFLSPINKIFKKGGGEKEMDSL